MFIPIIIGLLTVVYGIFLGYYWLTVDSEKTMVASYNDSYCAVSFSINILKVSFSVYFTN